MPSEQAKYSPSVLKLADQLMAVHGVDAMTALSLAQKMLGAKALEPQVPEVPVAPMPLNAHAATPAHLEDANLSAWQRYSDMLESQPKLKDPAMGQTSGKRVQGNK